MAAEEERPRKRHGAAPQGDAGAENQPGVADVAVTAPDSPALTEALTFLHDWRRMLDGRGNNRPPFAFSDAAVSDVVAAALFAIHELQRQVGEQRRRADEVEARRHEAAEAEVTRKNLHAVLAGLKADLALARAVLDSATTISEDTTHPIMTLLARRAAWLAWKEGQK
jgi:glutamine synthetase adenylyltransferase